jgi:hypothetical protein
MFQQLQRQQDPCRDGWTSTHGEFREALGKRAVHGRDQGRPWKRLGPLAEGMRFGDEGSHLEARPTFGQPMLEVSEELHRRLS